MRVLRFILISLSFLLVVGLPWIIYGKAASGGNKASPKMPDIQMKQEGPIEIEAEHLSYDKEEQLYQAHGNVEVVRGDFSLTAEHARLSAATNEMVTGRDPLLQGLQPEESLWLRGR